MKRKSLINNRLIQMLPLLILMLLSSATQIYSQGITPTPSEDSVKISRTIPSADDECSRLLDKTLDAFEKSETARLAVGAELLTEKSLRAKEEIYNGELLKAVALLTSSEKRNRSFFEKLGRQLGKVLEAATDPQTLATIAGLIILANQLKR